MGVSGCKDGRGEIDVRDHLPPRDAYGDAWSAHQQRNPDRRLVDEVLSGSDSVLPVEEAVVRCKYHQRALKLLDLTERRYDSRDAVVHRPQGLDLSMETSHD